MTITVEVVDLKKWKEECVYAPNCVLCGNFPVDGEKHLRIVHEHRVSAVCKSCMCEIVV